MPFVCTKCQRDVETQGLFCPFCGTAAPQPDAAPGDPYVGRTIADKYFVNGLIGTGGMGQVYKATHITLDRPVALKMLNKSFLSDASMVQRFHREARAASKLNHPNCISIQDFGQTEDGALYIAMEYLPGRSLAKLLADEFPLGEVRVVRIVGQILAALAEAHAAGIIHRDLKLANVMVEARRDEPDFVKVLDFGIAKLSEPGGGGQLTGTGIVCGTPGYMSPEQARGEELDARSDLYAVGVILYELLTGRLPFESETPMGFVAKHLTEIPVPPSARRPDVAISAGLDELVIRTLAKGRDERPASAEDLRELLFTCELSPEAPPPSVPGHTSTVVLHAMTPAPPSHRPRASPPPSAVQRPPAARSLDVAGARSQSGAHPAAPPAERHAAEPTQQSGRYAAPPTPGGGTVVTGGRTSPTHAAGSAQRGGAGTPPPAARAIAPTELTPAPRASTPDPRTASLVPDAAARAASAGTGAAAPPPEPRASRAPPSRTALFAGGAAAVVLLGAGSYALLRNEPSAAPAPEAAVAAPARVLGNPAASPTVAASTQAAAPAPDAAPRVVTSAAAIAETPPAPIAETPAPTAKTPQTPIAKTPAATSAAAGAPRPAVTRPPPAPPRPRKGSGALEVVEGMQVLKVPAAASGEGILTITASPWANVVLDGRELGETPREARVGEGTYRVRLSHPTLGTRETTVTVPAGRRTVHAANLSR